MTNLPVCNLAMTLPDYKYVASSVPSLRSGFPGPGGLRPRLQVRSPAVPAVEPAALATGASWVCYFRALQIGDASKAAPVDKMSLVFVAIFAAVFLGERPSLGMAGHLDGCRRCRRAGAAVAECKKNRTPAAVSVRNAGSTGQSVDGSNTTEKRRRFKASMKESC